MTQLPDRSAAAPVRTSDNTTNVTVRMIGLMALLLGEWRQYIDAATQQDYFDSSA
jgi:hypothetical protein